ncbi:MAG: hypothetical protein EOP32_00400 [Rhodococcus sp. (in: high G+C Gram-positive bacteria)]|nr:MAG: hypothetical protein EOP32_00400 [Rhodococcus sp. (in: high G+C Gram-positive bacteria)]
MRLNPELRHLLEPAVRAGPEGRATAQAPAAAERTGREPLLRRRDILSWLSERPGTAGRPFSRAAKPSTPKCR